MSLQDRTASSVSFESLPLELNHRTTSFLDRESLRQLRLTSRTLSDVASKALFSSIYFPFTEQSLARFSHIRSSTDLAKWVQTVCLITEDYNHDGGDEENFEIDDENSEISDESNDGISKNFRTAFQASRDFPNLSGISVIFTEDCALDRDGDPWSTEVPETFEWRNSILQMLLKTFEALPSKDRIHSLTIENLQNANDPTITNSPTFNLLLSNLRTLRLHIISEYYKASPENSIWFPEVHDFTASLSATWLAPTASNLENLTLYFDHYVGYCPLLDLRTLHLPRLKTLALGNMIFSHDWQLDWFLSHSATLEELYMDDCAILFGIRTFGGLDAENYIPRSLVPEQGVPPGSINVQQPGPIQQHVWFYERRWHYYFAAFEQQMRKLRHFRFGSGDWLEDRAFADFEILPMQLREHRYMIFDIGKGPCQYLSESEEGWRVDDKWFVRPRCDDEDRDAYLKLLATIGQAAPLDFFDYY